MRHGMVLALVLTACNASKEEENEAPTFTEIRDDILLPSCGFASCHGGGAGGLTLDEDGSHAALVDVPSLQAEGEILVVPGDAEGSYLITKLAGGPDLVDDIMPQGGSLPAEDIDLIRAWIDAGAADD